MKLHILYQANKKRLSLLLLAGMLHTVCFAQNNRYFFSHLTTENGLLANDVRALCQDSEGYMWIGTYEGLQRYDGKRFVNYLLNIHDPGALHAGISSVFEDSRHRLWLGGDAPYVFNKATGTCYNYNLQPQSQPVKTVFSILEDGRGDIWIKNPETYYKLNSKTNRFEDYGSVAGINATEKPAAICSDGKGNIWFGTSKGNISCYNPQSKIVYNRRNNPGHLKIFETAGTLYSFYAEPENIWWAYRYTNILYQYNFAGNTVTEHPLPSNNANKLAEVSDSKIEKIFLTKNGTIGMVIPLNGFAFYNIQKKEFEKIPLSTTVAGGMYGTPELFSDNTVYEDRDGDIWVGSDKGLNIFKPGKRKFTQYGELFKTGQPQVPALVVNGIIQDRTTGDVYAGYYHPYGGIVQMDSNLHFKKQWLYKKGILGVNQVWNLFQDDEGIIWAPNQARSVLKLNTRSGQLLETDDSLLHFNINCITSDAANDLWLGTWKNGLKQIHRQTGKISSYTPQQPGLTNPRVTIFSLYVEGDSIIWVGTEGFGLFRFQKKTGRFTHQYVYDVNNRTSISSNIIFRIVPWSKDTLLLATSTGLNFFNKKNETSSFLSLKDGLPATIVTNIEVDAQRNIWVGCNEGFCKITLNPLHVTVYDAGDGIEDNSIQNNPFLLLRNGNYLVPALKGFFAFNPAEITNGSKPLSPVITGFTIFGKYLPVDSFIRNKLPVSLSHNENSIGIEFSSLQFNMADKLKYYYQLEGIDNDWILASPEQAVNYHQLNNGHYVFRLKAVNKDGIESLSEMPLVIVIKPPLWKTWWFRIAALLLLLFLAVMFYRFRIKTFRAIQEEKLKVAKLNADQYKSRLEMEQVINYFTNSLVDKHELDDALWDVARNLIGRLGFEDCMIYLWNEDGTKMIQKAGYGPKGSLDEIQKQPFDVEEGQGIVGYVMKYKEPVIIPDTSVDPRYRPDEMTRLSEITVPIIYNDELIGIIDSEHHEKNFFTESHLQIMITIAAMLETKIHDINAQLSLRQAQKEKAEMQYETLKQQLNPHFLFNALASVIGLIKTDPPLAVEFIRNLNGVYRYVLQNKDEQLVTLQAELDFVNRYFQLQKTRFGKGLEIEISIEEELRAKKIVPVTLQNLIENAIKHNIIDNEKPLVVKIFTAGGYLVVQNNLQKKSFVETSNQQGLKNMSTLYHYLSPVSLVIEKGPVFFTVKIPLL